jgi:GDPmannose 4,6-dehydratase
MVRIKLGLSDKLVLGNLEACRDWGFAGEYVQIMWKMLQQETPEDFVVGMGETHSVREFCDLAFQRVNLDYEEYVQHDSRLYRPSEVDQLKSDPSKARQKLDWHPKTTFTGLVEMMVDADLERVRNTQ